MTLPTSGRTTRTAEPPSRSERRFRATPDAVADARRALDELLHGLVSGEDLENARLLTSELVTNAIRHGPRDDEAHVVLRVDARDDAVRVEVQDAGPGFDAPPPSGAEEVGGWGLVLVDRVADRWAIEPGGPTTVWFEIDRAADRADEASLHDSEASLRIALDAGRMGTWDWDMRSGRVRWSESLERIHGLAPGTFGGTFDDFQADMHPEDRARVLGTIEGAVHSTEPYALDYRIVRPDDGAVRWLTVRGTVLRDDVGRPVGMAGVCADITERKETERRLSVQYAVARVLSSAQTLDDATEPLLEAIGTTLGWELGGLWLIDDGVLRYAGGWAPGSADGAAFVERSQTMTMANGQGLPGSAWAARRPVWYPELAVEPNFPRAAVAIASGLHSGFAFPVTLGREVLGVVEFFSRRIREPDEPLLELMTAIGAQVGQFVERTQAEKELAESEARKSAVLESALEAIVTMDEAGRVVEMNAATAEMFGLDRTAAVGREVAELMIPPSLRARHREGLQRYRSSGSGQILGRRIEMPAIRSDGSEFPVELTVVRVKLATDDRMLFTAYIRDITPRRHAEELQVRLLESERAAREQVERAHERVSFLAEAGMALASSLDAAETLAKVADLVVPRLADWCSVDVLQPDGTLGSVAVTHVDPRKVEAAREYRRRFPPSTEGEGGLAEVLRSGEPVLYPHVTDEMIDAGVPDPEQRAWLRDLGLRSVMIVPLLARERAVGALTFASAESGRSFGEPDLELAQELARRAAIAIDNARLYEERSHIAKTLQRSLLPRRLPEVPGLELAALYQAAGITQGEVGGDFYDAFDVGDGAWGVVVGDVCGKGVEAAALTGMARHTIRSSAFRDPSPSGALLDLNRVMLREDGERFCTVALARLEPIEDGFSFTLACGGHPAAIVVRRDGHAAETVGGPGSLLGVFEDVVVEDHATVLRPGDQAILYTDGLVDARHPRPLDEARLIDLVRGCGRSSAEETVACLRDAVADPDGTSPDDVCVVVVRVAD